MNTQGNLKILGVVHFVHHMDNMIIMPLSIHFISYFDIQISEYSDIISAYMFGAFIATFLGFRYLERLPKNKAFNLTNFITAVFILLSLLVVNFKLFVFTRFIVGLTVGLSNILLFYFLNRLNRESSNTRYLNIGYGFAIVVGIPFSIFFAQHVSWYVPFLALSFILLLISGSSRKEFNLNESSINTIKLIEKKQSSGAIPWNEMLFLFIAMIANSIIVPYIMVYFINNLGGTELIVGLAFSIGGLIMMFSAKTMEQYAEKLGMRLNYILYCSLMGVCAIFLTTIIHNRSFFAIGVVLYIVLMAGQSMALNNFIVRTKERTITVEKYLSLSSSIQYLSLTISTLGGKALLTVNGSGSILNYYILGIISCVASLLSVIFIINYKKNETLSINNKN